MNDSARARSNGAPVVLIVEDESLIRIMLADELEYAGLIVIEAENADVAIAKLLARSDIGFVVTDIRMPGSIDGIGLSVWMREHRPGMPIVITSGFATTLDIEAINPAIVHIFVKPYRGEDVLRCLSSHGSSS